MQIQTEVKNCIICQKICCKAYFSIDLYQYYGQMTHTKLKCWREGAKFCGYFAEKMLRMYFKYYTLNLSVRKANSILYSVCFKLFDALHPKWTWNTQNMNQ